jgi:hypothetical protein
MGIPRQSNALKAEACFFSIRPKAALKAAGQGKPKSKGKATIAPHKSAWFSLESLRLSKPRNSPATLSLQHDGLDLQVSARQSISMGKIA